MRVTKRVGVIRAGVDSAWRLLLVTLMAACHAARPESGVPAACLPEPLAAVATSPASKPLKAAATFDSAWAIVARSHWDTTYNGVNWRAVRDSLRPKAVAAQNFGQLRAVLTQMIGTLGQSHFTIIHGELNNENQSLPKDQSGGLGITVRDAKPEVLVTAVRAGGPAQLAGIRPGFAILAVNGCPLRPRAQFAAAHGDSRQLKLARWRETSALLRGPVGDTIRLTVRNAAGRSELVVMSRDTEPGTLTKVGNLPAFSAYLETDRRLVAGRTIGIIRFNIWMPVLSNAFRAAIDSLRLSDAIVLDLRGNLGGIGIMAAGVAGHFTDTSLTLGTMIQRGSVQHYVINPQRVNARNERVQPFSGPLALVVDELSVSTSEIFAGGLQALGRARVFGAQTAGQALPSVAESLPNGDILYHAIANFLSPTGRPLEGAGVTPDVSTPLSRAQLLKGFDSALDAAVSWAARSAGAPKRPGS